VSPVPAGHATRSGNEGLVAGYEELRRQVLSGYRGSGLALFQRRGMREWMNACSLCAAPTPTKTLSPSDGEAVFPQGLHTEIVLVLAEMLLHRCQEARA
jgi:hypothetical protein